MREEDQTSSWYEIKFSAENQKKLTASEGKGWGLIFMFLLSRGWVTSIAESVGEVKKSSRQISSSGVQGEEVPRFSSEGVVECRRSGHFPEA
jgi:hypothetical protein